MALAAVNLAELPLKSILLWSLVGTSALVGLNMLYVMATKRGAETKVVSRHWFSKTIYGIFLFLTAALAISSFGSILQSGHLGGYALLAHLTAAGAFVFVLLAVAFLFLPNGASPSQRGYTRDSRWWLSRWSAVGLVVAGVLTAATMFTSMLPILDTQGLLEFAMLHRYAGLATVIFAVIHAYTMVCTHWNWR
ncbi:MAG: hypothetical protein ACE361_19550 [Aureliella sp.]